MFFIVKIPTIAVFVKFLTGNLCTMCAGITVRFKVVSGKSLNESRSLVRRARGSRVMEDKRRTRLEIVRR